MEVDSLERACPDCGALVAFFEWPGNEACPSCGRILYVNSTGQIGHAPVNEFPNP
jgi:ribosomal protein S27E